MLNLLIMLVKLFIQWRLKFQTCLSTEIMLYKSVTHFDDIFMSLLFIIYAAHCQNLIHLISFCEQLSQSLSFKREVANAE